MGGTPIVYSKAAAEGLLRWYDAEKKNLQRALDARLARGELRGGAR
jgi:hypothetical protein